jgi:hypothetical protein
MVAMRALAAVWSIIVALLLAWWATGIAINGSATLSTPWPLIVMASLGALIIAGGILWSRRFESAKERTRIVLGSITFVVLGIVLAFEWVALVNTTGGAIPR